MLDATLCVKPAGDDGNSSFGFDAIPAPALHRNPEQDEDNNGAGGDTAITSPPHNPQ